MDEIELTSRKEKKHSIWVEKYRPTTLSNYIGNDTVKDSFKMYVENQDIPHLLLYGGPGTGKTSLAKLLVKSINCDSIYINASDENGIDTVRNKIKDFAGSSGFKPLKIIILDECDFFTPSAQAALRPVMETYAMNTRFILTGNYHELIIEPIISRVQSFQLSPPSKKDVAIHLVKILQIEDVTFTNEDMAVIVNAYYPDIRKVIQFSQQCSLSGILKVSRSEIVENDVSTKIMEMLKVRAPLIDLRKFLVDQNLTRFEEIYQYLYDNVDRYAEKKQASVILALADAIRSDSMVANKQIVFVEFLIKALTALKTN
jgi:DNA polymerase III delta prime subunit